MQGMMLSERPAPSISTGMVDSSISIGNYKGVMLCNRPFAGAQGTGGATSAKGGATKHVFNCGTVGEDLGLNKKRSDMAAVKRTKKETALTRHRKWLVDLQRTKEAADKTISEESAAKEEAKKKFMEREAKLRAIVRSAPKEDKSTTDELATTSQFASTSQPKSESKDTSESDSKVEEGAKGEQSTAVSGLEAASKKRAKSGRPSMPMWALTEDKAAEVTTAVEEDELDDLLEFAKNLDFDKYMGDMEVSTMLATVKARIAELEAMPDGDEEFERMEVARGENRPQTLTAEKISALQQKYGVVEVKEDEDVKSVAHSLLSENRELGNIHSRKSVAAMTTARRAIAEEPNLAPPVVITHTDDDGTRLSNKTTVQKLPYMHRNPAL